jgi:hypothetical protein
MTDMIELLRISFEMKIEVHPFFLRTGAKDDVVNSVSLYQIFPKWIFSRQTLLTTVQLFLFGQKVISTFFTTLVP